MSDAAIETISQPALPVWAITEFSETSLPRVYGAKFCSFCGARVAAMADRCPYCARAVSLPSGPAVSVMPVAGKNPEGPESPSFLARVSRLRARFFGADR